MNERYISELDETTRHKLLADDQRRFVIESLQPVETTLGDLASSLDRVAQRYYDADAPARRNLRCRLHHVHLPMLDDAGLLEYDARTKHVRVGGRDEMAASPNPQ